MSEASDDRAKAETFADGDVLNILYSHHARVHELLDEVASNHGDQRSKAFGELSTLLQAHEAAEEAVVRPVTAETAGPEVAASRNAEEKEADHVAAALAKLDVDSKDFDAEFTKFKKAVTDHAEAEENKEFPTLESKRSAEDRLVLGKNFLAEFAAAGGR